VALCMRLLVYVIYDANQMHKRRHSMLDGVLTGMQQSSSPPHGRPFGMHKALPHEDALREHGPGIKRAYTYKSLNKLIQGSAADMTKKSMLELYKEGIVAHIQIHDELDLSIENDKQAKRIVEIMENAVTLEVPNKVDYEFGKNWGDIYD